MPIKDGDLTEIWISHYGTILSLRRNYGVDNKANTSFIYPNIQAVIVHKRMKRPIQKKNCILKQYKLRRRCIIDRSGETLSLSCTFLAII